MNNVSTKYRFGDWVRINDDVDKLGGTIRLLAGPTGRHFLSDDVEHTLAIGGRIVERLFSPWRPRPGEAVWWKNQENVEERITTIDTAGDAVRGESGNGVRVSVLLSLCKPVLSSDGFPVFGTKVFTAKKIPDETFPLGARVRSRVYGEIGTVLSGTYCTQQMRHLHEGEVCVMMDGRQSRNSRGGTIVTTAWQATDLEPIPFEVSTEPPRGLTARLAARRNLWSRIAK